MSTAIKLSSPPTHEFWEIPVLYEDEHLLALDKPSGLPASPDRADPERPSLLKLLHRGIAEAKPWAREGGFNYLMNAHRLDAETSGVILLARSKPVLVALANFFGTEKPGRIFLALAQGSPGPDQFELTAKLSPHPARPGLTRVDPRHGKRTRTVCTVVERFGGWTLLRCDALTVRFHQVRAHLRHAGLPLAGDSSYGGRPLWLSRLKRDYHLKPEKTERPLIARPALHAEALSLPHPVSGAPLTITAPWPKDFRVALKYLRRYAAAPPLTAEAPDSAG